MDSSEREIAIYTTQNEIMVVVVAVAAGSGTSGTSLVPFYFESLELLCF